MQTTDQTLPALLRHQATTRGDATAFAFVDGPVLGTGHRESLTWSQLYRRVLALAAELRRTATKGDRVAIVAPQGLDYIVAFYASLQAGLIAVPLSVPMFGAHDQRTESALDDSTPSVLLTTSAVVTDVNRYATPRAGRPAPTVIEVDLIDVDATLELDEKDDSRPGPAYLQYTSGSTRTPAGVIVSHRNVTSNLDQAVGAYFAEFGGTVQENTSVVSWLPFFHDMGLIMGVCAPVVTGCDAVLTSPLAFLAKPASWMQLMARNPGCFSGAPNFAFELAARRTSDADLSGLDLSGVHTILSGAERVHYGTIARFIDRFAKFGLIEKVIRPSYGLAEATLYVASPPISATVRTARFDLQELAGGVASRRGCDHDGSTELVSYGVPTAYQVRIVDPQTATEQPEGVIGEIWTKGDHVALGYWRKPEPTTRVFRGRITNPSEGTPAGPWLRTGDLGAISDGELFIMGRLKDLLIVDGRNHYPEDIEATIREITGGRVAAIAVEDEASENLVAIVEVKPAPELGAVRDEVAAAVWKSHNLKVDDLVLVSPGSIPITTSGKIRRSSCGQLYRHGEFQRMDIAV
ncbi:MAG: AMP-binding protein [Mycobacterium sp.]|nr:AMP-binding protein [Mycobacterium sp.]